MNRDRQPIKEGDRTKQGVIVGLENYPIGSYLGKQNDGEWRYTLLPDKTEEDLDHRFESEIQPLSTEEVRSQIEAEIQQHQTALDTLKSELVKLMPCWIGVSIKRKSPELWLVNTRYSGATTNPSFTSHLLPRIPDHPTAKRTSGSNANSRMALLEISIQQST